MPQSAAAPGGKTALTMTPCSIDSSGKLDVHHDEALKVLLNPSEFSHTRAISYNTKQTLGQVGADAKFTAVNPDTVAFKLMLDDTGAVFTRQPRSVEAQVKEINDVVYRYKGDEHEPSHVRLLWGTLVLLARLTSMSINYSLFKPSGEPLRATVDLKFSGFMSNKEAEARARRSSPDLTHSIVVREGDSLPLLCNRVYGDPSYYAAVARFNALPDVWRLEAGRALLFPPLA